MDFLMELLQQYGYYMVFVGTLLEGETIVALAGFIAHQGYLELGVIIPVAIVGAVAGDQAFFYFGRFKGRSIIKKHPNWDTRVARIHLWLGVHQNWLIFGSRFLYGFRAITPIVLGTSGVSGVRFFILNVLGAIVWACLFAFGGYFFGDVLERFLGSVKKFEGMIVASLIVVVLSVQAFAWLRNRSKKKQ